MSFPHLRPFLLLTVTALMTGGLATTRADGGTVLGQQDLGPYRVTVFGEPFPLRAGPADISVMVQDRATGQAVRNQNVTVAVTTRATSSAPGEAWVPPCCSMKGKNEAVQATHDLAQNKLLYAANVMIPTSGPHEVTVMLRPPGPATTGPAIESTTTSVEVAPPLPPVSAYWSYLALPPLLIGGFALHQRLRRRSA